MTTPDWAESPHLPPQRETVAATIADSDEDWTIPASPLNLPNDLRWRPDREARVSGAVLHVQLTDNLPSYIAERLRAAAEDRRTVHVALPIGALWNIKTVSCLSETDACIHLLNGDYKPQKPTPFLTALATAEIRLPRSVRTAVGQAAWRRCRTAATAYEKGWRLESLLQFLLSQSQELKLVESRLRTETEEIDIVAQARVAGLARCWVLPGSPFILLEAKNWSEPVGKPVVSDMLTKLRGYRQTAKVGILMGARGFTEDAKRHELRFASEEGTIVFVGPQELEAWLEADDLDEHLEALVRWAMLR